VRGAAVGVGADLFRLRFGRDGHQVGVHLVGAVVVTCRALHDCASAEVEMAAGHGGRAAGGRGSLQDQHGRTGCGGLDCGTSSGNAETGHEDVDVISHHDPVRCPVV
jgi:hypothetical protein